MSPLVVKKWYGYASSFIYSRGAGVESVRHGLWDRNRYQHIFGISLNSDISSSKGTRDEKGEKKHLPDTFTYSILG
jgi:hypothetical protein